MTKHQFDRLNALSEKIAQLTATLPEMKEFNTLLDFWNTSIVLD